jgi:hypothetical protein
METNGAGARPQRIKFGGPLKVLLVLAPAPLLQRMVDVVQSTDGVQLAASFASAEDAIDWTVWQREACHLAYVDMALPQAEDVLRRLSPPRAGTVVGVVDHLWREVRERCAAMGASSILEKGDLVAFRGDLEGRRG